MSKGASRVRPALAQAWKRLRGGELTPARAALSVGVGLCIGMLPLYGVHWALVLGVCLPLRLDVPVAYLAANISVPFIAPFLVLAEVQTGSLAMTGALLPLTADGLRSRGAGDYATQLVLGTALLAPSSALVAGALTYVLVRLKRGWSKPPPPAEKEQPLGT